MKKINFVIALSLLCCSYDSMGFGRRAINRIQTNGGNPAIVGTYNQNVRIAQPGHVVANPAYIPQQTNVNLPINNVALRSVITTEDFIRDMNVNGNRFALIEVRDMNGQNIRGSCGYNALHTTRNDVYNALASVFSPSGWANITDQNVRNFLSRTLRGITNNYERIDFEYDPQTEWAVINAFLRRDILNGGDVMDQNLAALVCYIRGEDLVVVNQNGASAPLIGNGAGIVRYLYNSGGHWQELRQR